MAVSEDLGISIEELALAARNHGMPLEALAYDVTPVGLHYLLIHYDIPQVSAGDWQLMVDGSVGRPSRWPLARIEELPVVTQRVTMECAGNGRARLRPRPVSQPWLFEAIGTAEWTGVRFADLLAQLEVGEKAREVLFTGLDRGVEGGVEQYYQRSLTLADATRHEVMLANVMNGQPLPPQHGYPLRLVVPGWYGMTSVKWLERITLLDEPFEGYQHTNSYRMRSDENDLGVPVSRMLSRSLMVPPGIPEFATRARLVESGKVIIRGRAWSGFGAIIRVEFSDDDGSSWHDAAVEDPTAPHAWQGWTYDWKAVPGSHVLVSKATDETGASQPLESTWNLGGYQVNAAQRVPVEATSGSRSKLRWPTR